MTLTTLIQAKGLRKTYGQRTVVQDVTLNIREGEVLAIIGPNGAGKSTTLDLVLGLRRPDAGTVTYWTSDPSPHIGLQLQSTPFFPGFTAMENLCMFAAFYGKRLSGAELIRHLDRCGLARLPGPMRSDSPGAAETARHCHDAGPRPQAAVLRRAHRSAGPAGPPGYPRADPFTSG